MRAVEILPPPFFADQVQLYRALNGAWLMTEFMIDEEDEDEINEFVHMPDEVMETVAAVALQKGIGMGEMMKLIFVQWYEQQIHGGNRLH